MVCVPQRAVIDYTQINRKKVVLNNVVDKHMLNTSLVSAGCPLLRVGMLQYIYMSVGIKRPFFLFFCMFLSSVFESILIPPLLET